LQRREHPSVLEKSRRTGSSLGRNFAGREVTEKGGPAAKKGGGREKFFDKTLKGDRAMEGKKKPLSKKIRSRGENSRDPRASAERKKKALKWSSGGKRRERPGKDIFRRKRGGNIPEKK